MNAAEDEEPTSLTDPVLALTKNYWFTCDLLHDRLHEVRDAFFSDDNPRTGLTQVDREMFAYLNLWLSCLWVVAHAFRHVLKLDDPVINPMIDEHFGSLSTFRNATFHYQRYPHKQAQFFHGERVNWAEDLHHEIRRYLADYANAGARKYRKRNRRKKA